MASFESNVLDRWPAGTKLGVFPRLGDSFSAALPQVKSASVGQDGSVKVSGLDEGAPYWLAGEGRAVAFTAKDAQSKVQSAASRLAEAHGGLQSAAPGYSTEPNIISGARSSRDVKARHQSALLSEDRVVTDPEPQPHVNQQDVPKGQVQRSDTAFGEATPKDRDEIVPKPSQDDVSKRELQRSDTESGEATPKPRDEVEPAFGQDDVKRGTVQRSDTPEGSAEPKLVQGKRPAKRAAVAAELERDSSESKAVGSTEQQSIEQTSKKNSK
jgi:hypothetical protein